MAPKKSIDSIPPYEHQKPLKEFDLFPLAPPDLGAGRYNKEGGYAAYVTDYKLYVATLKEMKEAAKKELITKSITPVLVNDPGSSTTTTLYSLVVNDGAMTYTVVPASVTPLQNPTQFSFSNRATKNNTVTFRVDPNLSVDGAKVSLKGHNLSVGTWANVAQSFSFIYVKKEVVASTTPPRTLYVSPEVKPKGPAQTPKKVRTPEEQAERDAKETQRKEKAAWFTSRKLDLAKGRLEEKLAKSVALRAQDIRKADPGVDTAADLDGWRVVTSSRKQKRKVKSVKKEGANRTTETYVEVKA